MVRVAIIGAGFSGVAAGYYLKRAGIDDFVIFERASGVGGTWWHNRYPGAAVDTWSHLYSFSFFPGDFTRTHVAQEELRQYIENAVDRFDLRRHIRLNTHVSGITWDDVRSHYHVRFAGTPAERFDAVISAVGMFTEPSVPGAVSLPDFAGEIFHSARWPPGAHLAGKRVAVIGTGSTATQIVPAIAPEVESLYVFQRQPNWVLPKSDRTYTPAERSRYRSRLRYRLRRYRLYWRNEYNLGNGRMFRAGTKQHAKTARVARDYLESSLAGWPELLAALTPRYPMMGKRPVVSSDWYQALTRDNVQLVDGPVVKLTPNGLVDHDGREYDVDAIVLATGFTANRYLSSLPVTGRHGQDLHAYWSDEPRSLLGVMVSGFPNFFLLYGPNTNGTTILSNVERQARFAAWQIRRLARRRERKREPGRGRGRVIEARPGAQRLMYAFVQRGCRKTVWTKATGYFVNGRGTVVTQWPYGVTTYGLLLWLARRIGVRTAER
jgi:cation diffusion facilitator CzcD-associated flavoprotein CzcO